MKIQLFKIKPFDMKNNLFLTSIIFLTLFCLYACGDNNSKQEESIAISELKAIFINGDSINYLDIGKGSPVVFVHGGLGDYRSWAAQMDAFAKNYRVIAYSRRYAFPNKQVINDLADYSVVPQAKDLAEFIKALDLRSVHLVGHSYGASIALLATMDHPELVRSLTLGEPPVFSLLENVPGGDTLMNNIFTKSFMPAADAFRNNNDEKALEEFVARSWPSPCSCAWRARGTGRRPRPRPARTAT